MGMTKRIEALTLPRGSASESEPVETLSLMFKFGVDAVRGWEWTTPTLTDADRRDAARYVVSSGGAAAAAWAPELSPDGFLGLYFRWHRGLMRLGRSESRLCVYVVSAAAADRDSPSMTRRSVHCATLSEVSPSRGESPASPAA